MFFHSAKLPPSLGPILRSARDLRGITLGEASLEMRLSTEELASLEEDRPLDPRLARLHAVNYARFLGLDTAVIRQSLPPLPELAPKHQQFLANAFRKPHIRRRSPWEALAPMGKFALYFMVTVILLSTWGMIRQFSRIRSVPWVTSTYTIPAR